MKPTVLYISFTGMTEPLGQSQVLNYVIGLSDRYKIHILSIEKERFFNSEKGSIQELCTKHDIEWHYIMYKNSPPILSAYLLVNKLKKKAFELHSKYQFKLAHCRSYKSTIVGYALKKRKGVKLLFDMRGFWADERVEGNIWNKNNPIYFFMYKYFKNVEKHLFVNSDHVVSLTKSGVKEIESWGLKNAPITYIPTCVDYELFDYRKISEQQAINKKRELGIPQDSLVLTYLGSIGTWYLTKQMLQVFKSIQQEIPNSKFLFITKEDPEIVYRDLPDLGIDKDSIIVTSSKRNQVPELLACTDLSIFFYRPTFSKKGTSPTKFGELMGMGIPVIANKNIGDVEEVIEYAKNGIVVDVLNEEELTTIGKRIPSILNMAKKENIRQKGIEIFDLKDGIKKYHKIYDSLLS